MIPASIDRSMEAGTRVAQLIRERKQAILARWEQRVRSHAIARALARPALFDSMPAFLEDLANAVEVGHASNEATVENRALEHAQQRLELGYELGQLVFEYGAFRLALLDELNDAQADIPLSAWRAITVVIEEAIDNVVHRFTRARERKVRALERVSSEVALTAPDIDTLLKEVVGALVEAVPEVDEVTVLLRDGNELYARATRGLEDEVRRNFSIAVGDGFAGTIAATREPLFLHDASTDPLVKSDVLRRLGVRALYGVPLLDSEQVIGVAHMGSKRAYDFQEEDLILFRAIANRATIVIAGRRALDSERANEELRERFVAMLGHDLRSPLNAVLGSAQLLLRHGQLDEHDRRAVDRITRATERMSRLVGDVLDFTRMRLGGEIPLSTTWVDLGELTRAACEEAELANPGRAMRLRTTIRSRVCCDGDRVAQLLSNLLSNAIRHGAPNTPVTVTVEETAHDALLRVHNEGPPIAPDLLPHLFEAFRQGSSAGAHGLGLGLFITKAIVVAHKGSIEVESDAGQGTTFVVRLPKQRD